MTAKHIDRIHPAVIFGYFIAAIAQGKSVEYALDIAAKASSITVSRPGASSSIPALNEVV